MMSIWSPTALRIFSKGSSAALRSRGGDVLAAGLLGRVVERPDLHRRDAFGEQLLGELVGAVQEAVEIVVVLPGVETVVGGRLALVVLDVLGAGAGVVGADRLPGEAAEQLRDRLARGLAEYVPERDVEGRVAAHLGAARAEAEIADEVGGQQVDRQRVAADDTRRDIFVQIFLDGARAVEGFAEAGDAFVGVHLDPQEVGSLLDADGLDRR